MKDFDLKGKVAIVTGASGLLGQEHCRALSDAGAHVVAVDLNRESVEGFAKTLPTESLGLQIDVTKKPAIEEVLAQVLDRFGRVDILVNNAAINERVEDPNFTLDQSKFENFDLESWNQCLDVNVTGVFLCAQVFGAQMMRQGQGGSIINIGSMYGSVGNNQSLYLDQSGEQAFFKSPVYSTTKGAVISFTRFLAAYWGQQKIRVNTLSPGGVENGQPEYFLKNYAEKVPMGRMAHPKDFRGALVFLASDSAQYVTGMNLIVDGGWTAW